jgi:WD40 repeat protein
MLWDLGNRRRPVNKPLTLNEGEIESVAFSPDSKSIAAGFGIPIFEFEYRERIGEDAGGGVVLWDLATRRRQFNKPLAVEQGRVYCVAFSPDGQAIAAGFRPNSTHGGNGGMVLWDMTLESWRRHAGRIANRNFTRDEWREYFPDTPYRATFPDLPIPPEETPK